jgi:hypothetical protein
MHGIAVRIGYPPYRVRILMLAVAATRETGMELTATIQTKAM